MRNSPSPDSTPGRDRSGWTLCFAALLFACAAHGDQGIRLPGCAPPPELLAELGDPAEVGRRCGPVVDCWIGEAARTHAVRERYFDQYDAHRAYVLALRSAYRARGGAAFDAARAEYEALAAANPENPAYAHLLAQLALEGAEYAARLVELTERHPDYPWAQLSVAFLARPDAAPEARERARAAFERFVAICPDRRSEQVAALERVGDVELWERHQGRLRASALAARDLSALARIWGTALRLGGEGAQVGVRATMLLDLAEIERLGAPEDLTSLAILRASYQQIEDPVGRERAEERLLALHPCSREARQVRSLRLAAGREAMLAAPERERLAWIGRALAEVDAASARCAGDESLLFQRIGLLRDGPDERSPELLAAIDQWLALPKREIVPSPAVEEWVAGLYLERRVRLERVPALLAAAAADLERRREQGAVDETTLGFRRRLLSRLEAELAIATGGAARARALLTELEAAQGAGAGELRAQARLNARLALLEGRREEALVAYAGLLAEEGAGTDLEVEARRAWLEIRGSDEGFADWRRAAGRASSSPSPWRSVEDPLPGAALEGLVDLAGSRLDWSALAGRTVFVRFWAPWCAPCREEERTLAALAAKFAERDDVTLALVDVGWDTSELVRIVATQGLPLDPFSGGRPLLGSGIERVPASWIVSREGRIVRRQEGPAHLDPSWIDAASAEIEAVASASPPASPAWYPLPEP